MKPRTSNELIEVNGIDLELFDDVHNERTEQLSVLKKRTTETEQYLYIYIYIYLIRLLSILRIAGHRKNSCAKNLDEQH